jgi:hypothetical protein
MDQSRAGERFEGCRSSIALRCSLSEDGVAIDHMLGAANYRALLAGEAPRTQPILKRWI